MAEQEYAARPAPQHPGTAGHGPAHSNVHAGPHTGEQGNQHGHKGKGHQ